MRFGDNSEEDINKTVEKSMPSNTKKSHDSVWRQFTKFCDEKGYQIKKTTSEFELNTILKSWAFNMKKEDGKDYKELVVKNMWNVTAKLLQEMFFSKWGVTINPFSDLIFKTARDARDAKRRQLQTQPEKRLRSASAITQKEYMDMIDTLDENTPDGLQKKFFIIASYELVWRGGEGNKCFTHYFKQEVSNTGSTTNRIEYNPIFSKTAQGGAQKLTESKWLIPNTSNLDMCPVRLYHKFILKRGANIKTDRLFLTPNTLWKNGNQLWYKNSPVGINEMSKWIKITAEKAGLNVKKAKISNHSLRSSAVSHLAKAGVGEQQLIKITGHNNPNSIKPYLQIDEEHHRTIIQTMRGESSSGSVIVTNPSSLSYPSTSKQHKGTPLASQCQDVTFTNCTFNFNN